MTGRHLKPLDVRFWEKVQKADGCWLWLGQKLGTGYGVIDVGAGTSYRKVLLAHRVSWELNVGPITPGMFICHHCDNPPCVRPDHLFEGTNGDNMRDAAAKGRMFFQVHPERVRRGSTHHFYGLTTYRGDGNGHSKLTAETVLAIRKQYDSGSYSIAEIARRAGMSESQSRRICKRQAWSWLPEAGR